MSTRTIRKGSLSKPTALPTGAMLLLVTAVCLGLAVSAGYGFFTLSRLRIEYLQNRAQEIASAVDAQARGPGRRNNPAFWQSLIEENIEGLVPTVAFLAVMDSSGRMLAGKCTRGPELFSLPSGISAVDGTDVYVFELPLAAPAQSHMMGMAPQVAGWRLRIGLFTSEADFIRRQAVVQIGVTGAAICLLLVLALYQVRVLRRFVALQARENSERHLKSLGVMSATLAHEIRNPLGAMKGLTQLAQEDLPEGHRTQALMKTIVVEAERLEKLVSDLLTFATFRQADGLEFDYMRLIYDVTAELRAKPQEAGKIVEVNGGVEHLPVHSDENGLRQVLLNVLLNALDFTPSGGKVTISVRMEEDSGTVVTEVDDPGPGIGSRDPEELFEPFTTTKAKGTGLGLAVSRQIVESLGGTITLANLPAGGARCSIRLPDGRR